MTFIYGRSLYINGLSDTYSWVCPRYWAHSLYILIYFLFFVLFCFLKHCFCADTIWHLYILVFPLTTRNYLGWYCDEVFHDRLTVYLSLLLVEITEDLCCFQSLWGMMWFGFPRSHWSLGSLTVQPPCKSFSVMPKRVRGCWGPGENCKSFTFIALWTYAAAL